ncbi:hypothetical protein PROFUN_03248 [Planoprotostelium fungivorum]|uniref:Uncharacterized protein n=1 Tax=Planoprotostelium fungivorum TaxID=1890364 RepID=A0A2P6NWJ3_9EUKA|nr:hypothetical protein PROFUN_03248 [Planoprotostelium fungivorum]
MPRRENKEKVEIPTVEETVVPDVQSDDEPEAISISTAKTKAIEQRKLERDSSKSIEDKRKGWRKEQNERNVANAQKRKYTEEDDEDEEDDDIFGLPETTPTATTKKPKKIHYKNIEVAVLKPTRKIRSETEEYQKQAAQKCFEFLDQSMNKGKQRVHPTNMAEYKNIKPQSTQAEVKFAPIFLNASSSKYNKQMYHHHYPHGCPPTVYTTETFYSTPSYAPPIVYAAPPMVYPPPPAPIVYTQPPMFCPPPVLMPTVYPTTVTYESYCPPSSYIGKRPHKDRPYPSDWALTLRLEEDTTDTHTHTTNNMMKSRELMRSLIVETKMSPVNPNQLISGINKMRVSGGDKKDKALKALHKHKLHRCHRVGGACVITKRTHLVKRSAEIERDV